jgi:hypothetical protein
MPFSAAALTMSPGDLAVLRRLLSARAKILLLAAEELANTEITERLGSLARR